MNLFKELWIEEYDKIIASMEEDGVPVDETYAGDLATNRSRERSAEYMQYAASKLKEAGFSLKATSMKSEACYYHIPASKKLLRIAAHRKSRTEIKYGVGKNTVACITFSQNFIPKSKEAIDKVIYLAVGKYFMTKEPE